MIRALRSRRRRRAAQAVDVPDRKDGNEAQAVGGAGQDLDDAGGAKAVENHVPDVVDARAELVVEGLEAPAGRVAGGEEVVVGVDGVAAGRVPHVALSSEFAEEDLGDGGGEDEGVGRVGLSDLSDVAVGVRVVDLVEGEDGGEFDGDEGGDEAGDGGGVPGLEGGFEVEGVKGLGDGAGGGTVAGELGLEGFDSGGFWRWISRGGKRVQLKVLDERRTDGYVPPLE